ncbi:MAG: S41 family peptidase [Bacteroidales bacterium]|nr:S41 family peptidase [Bacteroidales bacterium]
MKFLRKYILSLVLASSAVTLNAQSADFKTGKALEAQYNILRELSVGFVDTVDVEELVNVGIDAMLNSLDPYTEYIPDENEEDLEMMRTASYGGIGAMIRKIDSVGVLISQPYLGSPAVKYGIEPGDFILAIDGESVLPLPVDKCSERMKGQPGTQVKFLVRKGRTGEEKEIIVTRERVHIPDVSYSGVLRDSIGYIRHDAFTDGGHRDFRKAFMSLKEKGIAHLVIDLRSNGGGIVDEAVNILSLFLPKGTAVVSAKGRTPQSEFVMRTMQEPADTLIPITVLVNSGSASASEIIAGAIQDLDRGTIAGVRTYGKGLVQGFRPVGYNGNLKFTTAKYYTPSGRCVQAIDYSNRNSDGSVGAVPDSLKKAFKTLKKGRTVYDGGGITPDTTIKAESYSRPAYSLVANDIFGEYAIEYYKKHPAIASPAEFTVTDAEYEDFVQFASKKEFDSRSAAQAQLDQMLKSAKSEDLYDLYKAEFDALEKKLSISKEEMLRVKKAEFKPLLEEEIVYKYYYTPGRVESIIRNDLQLQKTLDMISKGL